MFGEPNYIGDLRFNQQQFYRHNPVAKILEMPRELRNLLTIEVKELPAGARTKKVLVLNGREITDSHVLPGEDGLWVAVEDTKAAHEMFSHTFAYLAETFSQIKVTYEPEWLEDCWIDVRVILNDRFGRFKAPAIWFELNFDFDGWAHPWSIYDFVSRIQEIVTTRQIPGCTYYRPEDVSSSSETGMVYEGAATDAVASEVLASWQAVLDEIAEQAVTDLTVGATKDTLVTLFEFPTDVATACEQYLLYFAQFLKDLDIDANVGIKHEARSVLFTVTPTDGIEALDRVRQALEIYLALPSAPHLDNAADQNNDVAVQQLQANIYHLKSQLSLSLAMIQAQKAQVEALELSNYRYRQLFTADRWAHSPEHQAPGEPILDGLVEIKPLDVKGATINLPEIFRRLRRRIAGR